MNIPSDPLSERERQAVLLAHDVHDHLLRWLTRQGIVTAALVVSPFVDRSGQPSVLLRLNTPAARALLRALAAPPPAGPRRGEGRHLS